MQIIHLDDHKIFREGIKTCIQKAYPDIIFQEFSDNQNALRYINTCFQNSHRINLIITDYNHFGNDGLEFAMDIRKLEKVYGLKTPIMLLSMTDDEVLRTATRDGLFDVYFTKAVECSQIINFINTLGYNFEVN